MTEVLEAKRPSPSTLGSVERDGLDYALYQESSRPPDAIGLDPSDGLPRQIPATSVEDSRAPKLSVERFVCMADTSEFVRRDRWGNVTERFLPSEVERTPAGSYRASRSLLPIWTALGGAAVIAPLLYMLDTTAGLWVFVGFMVALVLTVGAQRKVVVEPVRPQCQHYVRQLMPWQDDKGVTQCARYCAALKNEQGELLSLSNQELLACELRSPPSEEYRQIDEFDERLIALGKETSPERQEFDIDQALEAERAEGGLGIFGGR